MITGKEGFIGSHVEDIDGVIVHLDAITGISTALNSPVEAFLRNTSSTVIHLEAARQQNIKMVFASSAAAADPTNPYAASKAASEAWCEAYRHSYGVHVSILRFGNVYGPGSWHKSSCIAQMCKDAIEKGVITVKGGNQTRDFVYVEDVVKAIYQHPDGLHGVRTGQQYAIKSVAEKIAALSGAEILYQDGLDGASMDATPALELDYKPLDEGLAETWAWFTRHRSP